MILGIPIWAVCAIAAAFLAIGELFTPGLFFLGPLAVAAVVAALVATTVAGAVGPLLAFIGAAAICVMVLRPLARRAGEEWSARPYLEGDALPTGEQVEVAQIDGATALVLR